MLLILLALLRENHAHCIRRSTDQLRNTLGREPDARHFLDNRRLNHPSLYLYCE